MKGQPLYALWNTTWQNTPVTDYTIGIDTIPKMLEKMKAKPWPVSKIKLPRMPFIRALINKCWVFVTLNFIFLYFSGLRIS
jgi:hypothetical protein